MKAQSRILLLMSGSIAAAKATGLISEWVRRGHEVRVVCTRSVRKFVGPATIEGLSGHPVFEDAFEAGRTMDHITLAQWADLIVVCPATANLLNKLRAGIADDAVTTLWQAAWGRGKPQFVVPAMNTRMWEYPATRESVETLKSWGVHVLPTAEGDLACGERGFGRMLEAEAVRRHIERVLAFDAAGARRRVLVTAGGTREAIDPVRFIGNHSTGRTGADLTDALAEAGHEVTWLGARYAREPEHAARLEYFEDFGDLDRQLRTLLGENHYDVVVHAAAVSDFSVTEVTSGGRQMGQEAGKLASDRELLIRLTPNPKLLERMRGYSSNPNIRIVGFKLTVGADEADVNAVVERLFRDSHPDAVVHNDLLDIDAGRHTFSLHRPAAKQRQFQNSRDLARGLLEAIETES